MKQSADDSVFFITFYSFDWKMEIKINQLKKRFDEKVAVDIEDFTIHNGDILGLVGNNGAGKTTFFRLLLDLLRIDEGNVFFKLSNNSEETVTMEPSKSEEWKKFTGAYIDEGFLIDFLTPEEYFEFVAKINGIDKEGLNAFFEPLKGFMNDEVLGKKKLIRDYSAGNKQKIGIISTLLSRPRLIILDEPFNFLDPSSQNILKKMILQYHEDTGATILISSHNLRHTVEISNRIALLEAGKIIKDLPNADKSANAELEDYFNV